jgi:hypothetical protein
MVIKLFDNWHWETINCKDKLPVMKASHMKLDGMRLQLLCNFLELFHYTFYKTYSFTTL